MATYLLRRLLYLIPTLLGVNLVVFLLFFLVNSPDDMARQALGDKASNPEQIDRWKEAHGYHQPLFLNPAAAGAGRLTETIFFRKSLALFWGDFGRSDMTLEPLGAEIRQRMGPSLCITAPIFLGTLLVNVLIAMLAASRRASRVDLGIQLACVFLMSISTLIFIIAGQYLFAKILRLVPVSGFLPGADMVKFLLLPVGIGVLGGLGGGIRLYRTFFLEEISKDYVRTARAKGLSEGAVLFLHVLKNAMIPILTNVPMQILMLFMGNMLLESFFSIPGLGGYTIMAVNTQDFAVVRVMVFLGSALYIAGLLLTDICYAVADPRVRLQ
jgi:peptide/nickel transport system permease protein